MIDLTSKVALVSAAALFAIGCDVAPLDPTPPPPVDAGSDATASPPSPTSMVALVGIWSGQISVSAPGFAWGPFDRLTIAFDANHAPTAVQFASNFPPPHTFGPQSPTYPLEGTRDVPLVTDSTFTVRATVLAADFQTDRFHLRHRIESIGDTPGTDYVEDLLGQLAGDTLQVQYAADGTLLTAVIHANASGDLHRN